MRTARGTRQGHPSPAGALFGSGRTPQPNATTATGAAARLPVPVRALTVRSTQRKESHTSLIDKLRRYRVDAVTFAGNYGEADVRNAFVPDLQGNALSSRSLTATGLHCPVLDIDFGVQALESSTPDHHHLVLDQLMSWRSYRRLLRALHNAGVIERDWYRLAKRRRMTVVSLSRDPVPGDAVATTGERPVTVPA